MSGFRFNRAMKNASKRRSFGFESLESREYLSAVPLSTLPDYHDFDWHDSDWFEQLVAQDSDSSVQEEGAVSGQWLIQLDRETLKTAYSVSAAADYLQPYGITVLGGLGSAGTLHVRMESGDSRLQSEILAGISGVEAWEQNVMYVTASVADTVDDPLAAEQWALDTINVLPAWDALDESGAAGVVVAVLDTGIQLDHPDLQANIWTNPNEISDNGIDDDGNGFIDDVHGWNTAENSNDVNDAQSHGTHVAGIIAAVADNGLGVTGIAPGVRILPVKLGNGTFGSSAFIAAMNYVVKLKTEYDVNIRVVNASFGDSIDSSIFRSVLSAADAAGIVFVAAAGNSAQNVDTIQHAPSDMNDMPNVLSVAASNKSDHLYSSSNYGVVKVDLAAPGSGIYSTIPDSQYGTKSGTSMATAMVSGAAALLATVHPDWSAAMIKEAILATVDPVDALSGKVKSGGRLNVGSAIAYVFPIAPTLKSPTLLKSTSKDFSSVTLTWRPVAEATSYRIEYSASGDAGSWETAVSASSSTTVYTVTGLDSKTRYFFRIVTIAPSAESNASSKLTVTTVALPAISISTSGYAITKDGEFGFRIRIRTPSQNDTATAPILPAGCTFRYELVVADDQVALDRTTGLLEGGINLGLLTFVEGMVSGKPCADSSVVPLSDLAALGDLTTMKNLRYQLLVGYFRPGADEPFAVIPSKVVRCSLPKWYI